MNSDGKIILFLFLDGVGLGLDDAHTNPFVRASMPHLTSLLGGRKLVASSVPFLGERASLLSLDAGLGVGGLPQSATGQAVLLTGQNIPAAIGYHYGPKPNEPIAAYLRNGNLFSQLAARGRKSAFLNAYPPRYFEAIQSGKRIYSAIPLAATSAGLRLKSSDDLLRGTALAADFTAQGWHDHLGLTSTPVFPAYAAGQHLARLAGEYDFSFFEYWLSDYAGHHQDMDQAVELLETFDQVLGGLTESWDDTLGLILITSDHGNLEDLSTRRHTHNRVPALVIGAKPLRIQLCANLHSLLDITPSILAFYDA